MKSLLALAITTSALTSLVSPSSFVMPFASVVNQSSAAETATSTPTPSVAPSAAPSGESEPSEPKPISDADRQLLAEMGIDSSKAMEAQASYEAKLEESRKADSKAEAAKAAWERVEERLEGARALKIQAESDAAEARVASDKAVEDVGVIASEMYKRGGVDPSWGALLSGNVREIENVQHLDRIMAQQEGTVQETKMKASLEDSALTRAQAVEDTISALEAEALEARESADELQASAKQARDEAAAAMTAAGDRAEASKNAYRESVAESKRQADEFAEQQKILLAQYRAENNITAINMDGLPPIPEDSEAFPLLWPTTSGRITSGYGWRPTPSGTIDYGGQGGYVHTGIDYGVACGTPVYAPLDGTVWLAGSAGTAGNAVGLNHGVVDGFAFATRYHHLTRASVELGDSVKKGQLIGISGTTGNSNGCHLHFETMVNGEKVDPAIYMGSTAPTPLGHDH